MQEVTVLHLLEKPIELQKTCLTKFRVVEMATCVFGEQSQIETWNSSVI